MLLCSGLLAMNNIYDITGAKTRTKRSDHAKCWEELKHQLSIGEITIELKGIPINDQPLIEMLGQYLIGLSNEKTLEKKRKYMKEKRAKAKRIKKKPPIKLD